MSLLFRSGANPQGRQSARHSTPPGHKLRQLGAVRQARPAALPTPGKKLVQAVGIRYLCTRQQADNSKRGNGDLVCDLSNTGLRHDAVAPHARLGQPVPGSLVLSATLPVPCAGSVHMIRWVRGPSYSTKSYGKLFHHLKSNLILHVLLTKNILLRPSAGL